MPDHFTDENEGEPVAELVQRLRGRADWYDDAHPGTVKTPQALREAASAIERLQRELDEARALLTRDHSLPHDWTLQQVIEGRLDDINKLKWQVRDTCIRAEAAEASLVKAREANSDLHRRVQAAEAFTQAAHDIPDKWRRIFRELTADAERRHFELVLDAIIKDVEKRRDAARAILGDQP